jgi:transcriptional regulator with XRE-family HTH domain
MSRKPTTVSTQLRAALLAAPVSRYRIWRETGIEQATLSRFARGRSGLDLPTVDKLAAYLGLEIVAQERGREAGKP